MHTKNSLTAAVAIYSVNFFSLSFVAISKVSACSAGSHNVENKSLLDRGYRLVQLYTYSKQARRTPKTVLFTTKTHPRHKQHSYLTFLTHLQQISSKICKCLASIFLDSRYKKDLHGLQQTVVLSGRPFCTQRSM